MTVEAHKETMEFKAEVSQVLNLVIRSLYSNKEVFLRELVSNASDAAEKLRFEALSDDALYENEPNLRIRVSVDKAARTVTIADNGIGMSRHEVADTIGTIASSGTRKFLESLSESGNKTEDNKLIGQFGVGFYSAFIVADRVSLTTRRAGLSAEHGVRWESAGEGSYSIETCEKAERGTEITLHLRADDDEFLDEWRLRSIISKFSDHVAMPIEMLKEAHGDDADADADEGEEAAEDDANEPKAEKQPKAPEWEQVNKGTALWMRNKSDITEEEYHAFYKHIGHDWEAPLAHSHNRVEGDHEYTSLLFIPGRAPFDLWDRDQKHGVKLFVRRVFIMDEADKLMPHYLRFVKGVVDSDDLPLNVSREILQHNKKIDTIRNSSTKRILDLLTKMAADEPENYAKFWKEFGKVLKEGPAEDFKNREKIASLFRFSTTKSEGDEQTVSLDDYIARMKEKQDKIYYIAADTMAAARYSPHLEVFKQKDVEVLLLTDRVDEWLVSHLSDYKDKHIQSVAKGQLDLGDLEDKEAKEQQEKLEQEHKPLAERVQKALGDKVQEVRISHRLTESPACLVVGDYDMSANFQRLLKQVGQNVPGSKPILEINPTHALVSRMDQEADEDLFGDYAGVLFDQATLAEGGQLDDPAGFVRRLNKLMLL